MRGVSTGTSIGADGVQGNIAPIEAYAGNKLDEGAYKPKGKNLTEDPELHGERKFGAIGTKNDPARVAELQFAKQASAVGGGDKGGIAKGGDSKFSGLGDEAA